MEALENKKARTLKKTFKINKEKFKDFIDDYINYFEYIKNQLKDKEIIAVIVPIEISTDLHCSFSWKFSSTLYVEVKKILDCESIFPSSKINKEIIIIYKL